MTRLRLDEVVAIERRDLQAPLWTRGNFAERAAIKATRRNCCAQATRSLGYA